MSKDRWIVEICNDIIIDCFLYQCSVLLWRHPGERTCMTYQALVYCIEDPDQSNLGHHHQFSPERNKGQAMHNSFDIPDVLRSSKYVSEARLEQSFHTLGYLVK